MTLYQTIVNKIRSTGTIAQLVRLEWAIEPLLFLGKVSSKQAKFIRWMLEAARVKLGWLVR